MRGLLPQNREFPRPIKTTQVLEISRPLNADPEIVRQEIPPGGCGLQQCQTNWVTEIDTCHQVSDMSGDGFLLVLKTAFTLSVRLHTLKSLKRAE